MTKWMKGVAAALVLAGSAFLASEPAQARVGFGIYIGPGGPDHYYRGGYDPVCDPFSRWYNPYRCDARLYDDPYFDGLIFIDGFWHDGYWRHRHHHGRHQFWFNDRWREGHWKGRGHHRRHGHRRRH
jgi:hypothetical protein